MPAVILQNTRFPTGRIVITANAKDSLNTKDYNQGLSRHFQADWGDLCEEDRQMNELALRKGGRLFSVYHTPEKVKYWVITEADYSATTVLLPEDY